MRLVKVQMVKQTEMEIVINEYRETQSKEKR
ncbi:hypothetical protein BROOK1789C_1297 [Bathymodiolus brooksi thiotrophic gill symbiont]|jgi:hypothetical protein|nr:hypothetical protein BROOK1789C_1297 [Bathymodiolus brooksi thiotrophic gill symbiont]